MKSYIGKTLKEAIEDIAFNNTETRIIYTYRENILTADFKPDRINLHVDENDIVIQVSLG